MRIFFKTLSEFDKETLTSIFANYGLKSFKKELEDASALQWYGEAALRYQIKPLIKVITEFCKDEKNLATVRGA